MKSKDQLRALVREDLGKIIEEVNLALLGKNLKKLEKGLQRLGRGQQLPHWYPQLKGKGTLPNLDGKTIGSVIEMVLVAVLEGGILASEKLELRINPARGVDLPDLDLGIKSPSKNYCTSEPFFSAYERLYGSNHDVIVLLTDYQEKKKKPPLRLQITKWAYLNGSELADKNLCTIASAHRKWLLEKNEAWAKKFFKFLAYVNQSDWQAKQLLRSFSCLTKADCLPDFVKSAEKDFTRTNEERAEKSKPLVPDEDLGVIRGLLNASPQELAIIDAADNWVLNTFHEASRAPNTNEWEGLKNSPLNGKIGVSPALQWRYNFGKLFNGEGDSCDEDDE